MGPCHSLLGVNLLCPQSCFSLSHFSPFHRILIAHWILSSHRLIVFRRIQPLPSATRWSDQQRTSDLFSRVSECTPTIHLLCRGVYNYISHVASPSPPSYLNPATSPKTNILCMHSKCVRFCICQSNAKWHPEYSLSKWAKSYF